MKLKSGEFETEIDSDGDFAISICHKSNCSSAAGRTFEDVTNTFFIEKRDAKILIEELQHHFKLKPYDNRMD